MTIEFQLPELGENIENGDVVNVLVSEGQVIAANDGVVEIETEKAVVEIPCPHAGKVAAIRVKKGDTVKVGQTLLEIEPEEESAKPEAAETAAKPRAEEKPAKPEAAVSQAAVSQAAAGVSAAIPAGPAARRLARQLGVDLAAVEGSGRRGRITPEDVESAAPAGGPGEKQPMAPGEAAAPADKQPAAPGEPGKDAWGPIRRDRLSKIRQTIAAQMSKSASTIPHVTNFDDADVTELEALRKGVPAGYLGENVKLTTMPFAIKAVALALRRHPIINASLDEANNQVVYKEYVNVGIAVDTPRGLVVPALRGADRLSIAEIARQLADIARRARNAQFAMEELRGGTFTISNLGAIGGAYSTPIINHPEVAILLLGRSRWLPAVRDGKIEPRLLMPLSLSYDHRLVDGAAAGRFLNDVIDYLQSPARLLLGD
jgi:pyruvate dehydrogenase E2 component (dihydrolipoamide acetyltransferase)